MENGYIKIAVPHRTAAGHYTPGAVHSGGAKSPMSPAPNHPTLIPAFVMRFSDDGISSIVVDSYPLPSQTTFEDAIQQIIADGYIDTEGIYYVYVLMNFSGIDFPGGQLFQVTKDLEVIPGLTTQHDAPRITRWPPKT